MMVKPSHLDDPEQARFAWNRYRQLMAGMVLAALGTMVLGLAVVEATFGPDIGWLLLAISAAGIFLTVLLAAALMGLVFLSHGTGHDDAVEDPLDR